MNVIWKFPITVVDKQQIDLPVGAKVLDVQAQHNTACIWAMVDPNADLRSVTVNMVGTGHEFNQDLGKYLGSFQLQNGAFVGHVFLNFK